MCVNNSLPFVDFSIMKCVWSLLFQFKYYGHPIPQKSENVLYLSNHQVRIWMGLCVGVV